jgi:peptidoglycan/LPS O-acetylase OafA/YrhL
MAIGALGAFAVKSMSAILPVVFSKSFQFILYALFVLMFASASSASYQFYSVIFILIILNMAINVKSIVNIQNKVLDYLGKISYGIYMFHALTIIPSIYLVVKVLRLEISLISELLICFISLSSTIIVASISYYFYESYFLRLKDKHL